MNKSTIGIVLLVSMVLTKTYLNKETVASNMVRNSDSEYSNLINRNNFFSQQTVILSDLIAQDLSAPEQALSPIKNREQEFETDILVSENSEAEELGIIPLETTSNTGYGLWEFTSSISSDEESVPLDRGNTIMDGISAMFPPLR